MIKLIRVEGDSMSPSFEDGDYVLLINTNRIVNSLNPGDIIAFRQIAYGVMIKRIKELEPDSGLITVMGDNPAHSTDSRHFGPVHRMDVIGKVVWHIGAKKRA